MNQLANRALFVASITAISATVYAAITLPHSFSPNTTAQSSQVNANFTALLDEVNALRTELDEIKAVMKVEDDEHVAGSKKVVFTGVNVQIVNGNTNKKTDDNNGLGNLIIGYNKASTKAVCSKGGKNSHIEATCTAVPINGTWAANQRTGSHSVIIGDSHNYTSYGSLIAGLKNTVNSGWSTVSGGTNNEASGRFSAVTGGGGVGFPNRAQNYASVISGGAANLAQGDWSSISGGYQNKTTCGSVCSVTGGQNNEASANYSAVTGGLSNQASASYSAVTGGQDNQARGAYTSVNGGRFNQAIGNHSSISGGGHLNNSRFGNIAYGALSSISGGTQNVTGKKNITASNRNYKREGTYTTISGGHSNRVEGNKSHVSGGHMNTVYATSSSILGGWSNRINQGYAYSSVGGGNSVVLSAPNTWKAEGTLDP